jgi:hypothetical protein
MYHLPANGFAVLTAAPSSDAYNINKGGASLPDNNSAHIGTCWARFFLSAFKVSPRLVTSSARENDLAHQLGLPVSTRTCKT